MTHVHLQPADTRSGMVNVRSDDDLSPEEVLAQFEAHHQQKVLEMAHDSQVGDGGALGWGFGLALDGDGTLQKARRGLGLAFWFWGVACACNSRCSL